MKNPVDQYLAEPADLSPFVQPRPAASGTPFGLPPLPPADEVQVEAGSRPVKTGGRDSLEEFERRFLSQRYRGGAAVVEVARLWAGDLQSIQNHAVDGAITVGPTEADYLVEDERLSTTTELVALGEAGSPELNIREGMGGYLVVTGEDGRSRRMSFAKAVETGIAQRSVSGISVPLDGQVRARVDIGSECFLIHKVSAQSLGLPFMSRVGLLAILFAVLGSMLLHGAAGAMVAMSTERADLLSIDQRFGESSYGEVLLTPTVDEEEEVKDDRESELASEESEGSNRVGEAGESGTPDQVSDEGRMAVSGNEETMIPAARDVATESGLMAERDELEVLLASSMPSSGYDAVDTWGKFDAEYAAGNTRGTYGLSMYGTGRSAGGDNTAGLFGPGRLGTVGKHNPDAAGGLNDAKPDLGPDKKTTRPTVTVGRAETNGTLDKRIIRKVVRQHRREIKACYERQLQREKGLHGKLEVKWFIDGSGNVAGSYLLSSTMGNKAVESCVVKSVEHWRFPAPKEGATVAVTYPFVFSVDR